jgi:glucosylceramidase
MSFGFSGNNLISDMFRLSLSLVFSTIALVECARAQQIRVYVTSEAGDRLSSKPSLSFRPAGSRRPDFRIDDSARKQEMVGFGASFLESGMICLNSLDSANREKLLKSLFDPDTGAGFSAMKTVIAATDFMAAGPFYTYDDHPGDNGMKLFSIQRDFKPNGLIAYIKHASRYGHFVLQAPMDYPPDWMLFDVNKNQDVNPKYFPALAQYYVRYAQAYQKAGIFIDFVSLFNEPSIYTKIPADKIRDLLRDYVGPTFAKEGIHNGIMACEPPTREVASRYLPVILDDPSARKYVGAIAYHGYEYKDYGKMSALQQRYPDLKLWMTEICHAYETDTPRTHPMPYLNYDDGDFWGNEIFNDLEAGSSAWIYWNMILDETGGPWLVSPIHGNPENNNQHPVVIVNRRTKEVTYTGLYYYLAHFSKFVRPGAVRIQTTGSIDGVRCMAFQSKGGGFVMEAMNRRKQPTKTVVEWRNQDVQLDLPPLSISTYIWK